jgi:ribosomal-protein-alanine N-acetyltransferase
VTVALPTSPRLAFDALTLDDADFLVELLNDDAFQRYIGDRGVRAGADVAGYLAAGPWASYAAHGFGLLRLSERGSGAPVGIAGLLKRPTLEDVDLGYALLPAHRGHGYAVEAGRALLTMARESFDIARVLAIVTPENTASIRTLEALGFSWLRRARLQPTDPELCLYEIRLA